MRPLRLLLALLPFVSLPAAAGEACSSPEVRAEIAAIRQKWNIDSDPTWEHQTEALRELVAKHPRDVEARLALYLGPGSPRDSVLAEARKLHEGDPDSPEFAYVYARLLPQAEKEPLARTLVEKHPDFPWGHLLAADVENAKKAARNDTAIRDHLTRFMALCPDSLAPFLLASQSGDKAFLASSAVSLRRILETDREASAAWHTLWTLEFKAASPGDYAAVRERVRKDVARLWPLLASYLADVVLEGTKLVEDPALHTRAEDEILKARPTSREAFWILEDRFNEAHPQPAPGAPPADVAAFQRAYLAESKVWTSRFGDYPEAWSERLGAVEGVDEVPDAEVVATWEGLLAALQKRPSEVTSTYWPFEIQVAHLYVSRGIRLPEAIALTERAVSATEKVLRLRTYGTKEDFSKAIEHVRWLARPIVIEAKARLGEGEEAERLLKKMEADVPPEPGPGAPKDEQARARDRRSLLEQARAGVDLAAGHAAAALSHYRAAASSYPPAQQRSLVPGEAIRRARILWRQMYGNPDGFEGWLASNVDVSSETGASWTTPHRRLPDFALTDTAGQIWKLADLRGKTTFIVLWATWCGPCREELPCVEELFRRIKARKDFLLLTLNLDANPGAVGPFLKRESLTFPVLLASRWVTDFFPGPIPRTWIISSDGTVELESLGFASEPKENWVKRMMDGMGRVSAAPSP